MSRIIKIFLMFAVVALAGAGSARVAKAQVTVYTVLNDNVCVGCIASQFNSGSVFVNGAYTTKISTGSYGIGGGYLGSPHADIEVNSGGKCIFLADAGGVSGSGPGDIAVINYPTLVGLQTSNYGGNGYGYGIGLAQQGSVLVASWTTSGTLETFTVGAGCALGSGTEVTTVGLNGGSIDGLAIAPNGTFVALTYNDGSYGMVSLSGATLGTVSQYISNCYNTLALDPTGVAIDPTSTYVYMDCGGTSGAVIDAYNVSAPGTTVTNGPLMAAGGPQVYGSNTMGLSANGVALYIVGTFRGAVESAKVSGTAVTANSCSNVSLPGVGSQWIYAGSINVVGPGAGVGAVVTESGISPGSFVELLKIGTGNCLSDFRQGTETNSFYALSGASYFVQ